LIGHAENSTLVLSLDPLPAKFPLMKPSRLFAASCVALIVTAMSFALRGEAAGAWATQFHLTHEQIGWINGTAFWGFTLAMIFGGPLCDIVGLGRIVGIANGSVEAACNPLIATLFPQDKTTKLNRFHVWFPGGIVIGGLLAFFLGHAGFGWKIQFACMLVPLAVYGAMFMGQSFPRTERVQQGVSTGAMFSACLSPLFLLMVVCMLMTAATELGPGQWIPNILTNAGVSGILVLVWITGLMAVGRQFAGVFVHRLSPMGMLFSSAVLSTLGLYAMSHTSGTMLFAAATVFALGVCFFWPTMLGYVSENFPRTGALGLAIMGGAGMLSAGFILPVIGRYYDKGIAARLPAGKTVAELTAAAPGSDLVALWTKIQADAGLETLGKVAVLPVVLAVIFLVLLVARKKKPATAA
jgi:MFS family permease